MLLGGMGRDRGALRTPVHEFSDQAAIKLMGRRAAGAVRNRWMHPNDWDQLTGDNTSLGIADSPIYIRIFS